MRIIGEIPYPAYKITVMKMNEKVTIQIEDRLVSQSYVFRDGSGVKDLATATQILNTEFMDKVKNRFVDMNADYMEALEQLHGDEVEDFEII